MTEYLLAAEADQIQDFIFRASHLREVVGGSQLLTRFCNQVPQKLLGGGGERIVVNDGGALRVVFDDPNKARAFSEHLAEIYRRAADGTITVAEPEEIKNGDFAKASEAAEEQLRVAKRWRKGAVEAVPQIPFVAWCASCGAGLAVAHGNRHADERANYLCQACNAKGEERDAGGEGAFLRPFLQLVTGGRAGTFPWPMEAKDSARFDLRRYVAYLLADGNNLGRLFGQCNEMQMKDLSEQMTQILRQSLATPTGKTMARRDARGKIEEFKVPVLPLILGGDDLFALLPAPWALDFALSFCREFEAQMEQLEVVRELKVTAKVDKPTIAAAVVICKESYPYRLAHRAGQERLQRAKRLSKALAYETGEHMSVVDFEIILGSQIVEPPKEDKLRSTLRPFWVLPNNTQPMPADGWGLPLHRLIEQRAVLSKLPNKRLAQLRTHFDQLPDSTAELVAWGKELEQLLGRVGRDEEAEKLARSVLAQLGSRDSGWLYSVNRKTDEKPWQGHALPDLLEAWDFALDLDKDRDDYEEA